MTTTKPFQLGTVISGTLRTEDLLSAYMNTLARFDPNHYLLTEYTLPSDSNEMVDAVDGYLETLTAALCDHCPPFVYFGAHPGDGADFGFWPDHDAIQEAIHWLPRAKTADWSIQEFKLKNCIIRFVEGKSNVTVMDLDRNVLWSTV